MTNAGQGRAEHAADEGLAAYNARFLALPMPVVDIVIGAILTAFAVWLWVDAGFIERSSRGLIGPAGFPRGVALLLGAVSLLMAARAAFELRFGRGAAMVQIAQPVAVFAALILVIVYPVLLGHFGYYLVTGPWLVALLFVTGNRKLAADFPMRGRFSAFHQARL